MSRPLRGSTVSGVFVTPLFSQPDTDSWMSVWMSVASVEKKVKMPWPMDLLLLEKAKQENLI